MPDLQQVGMFAVTPRDVQAMKEAEPPPESSWWDLPAQYRTGYEATRDITRRHPLGGFSEAVNVLGGGLQAGQALLSAPYEAAKAIAGAPGVRPVLTTILGADPMAVDPQTGLTWFDEIAMPLLMELGGKAPTPRDVIRGVQLVVKRRGMPVEPPEPVSVGPGVKILPREGGLIQETTPVRGAIERGVGELTGVPVESPIPAGQSTAELARLGAVARAGPPSEEGRTPMPEIPVIQPPGSALRKTPYDDAWVLEKRAQQVQIPETSTINTQERQAMRREWERRLYGSGAPLKNRVAAIIIGRPGAGKSTALSKVLAEDIGGMIVDPDTVYEWTPEAAGGFAGTVHKETSQVAWNVLIRAAQVGDNLVVPVVGKNPGNVLGIFDTLARQGYQVSLHYVELPEDKAVARAIARGKSGQPGEVPRFVDPDYIVNDVDEKPGKVYDEIWNQRPWAYVERWSNDVPRGIPPQLVDTRISRGGQGRPVAAGTEPLLHPTGGLRGLGEGDHPSPPVTPPEGPAPEQQVSLARPPGGQDITLPAARLGRGSTAETSAGTKIDTQFAVVDGSELIPSHDADFAPNPAYPAELQPRQRDSAASQNQITRFIERLAKEPSGLGDDVDAGRGAPIIGPDRVVESGNGRVIGVLRAYRNAVHGDPAAASAYRGWLYDHLQDFGINPRTIEALQNPILVRVRRTPVDRVRFAVEANEVRTMALSPVERAVSDARLMPEGLLNFIDPGAEGDLGAIGNREFVRRFAKAVVGESDMARFVDAHGNVSAEGLLRVRNAVFAKAYGADLQALSRLAESADPNVRNVTAAMVAAAPRMAKLRAEMAAGVKYPLDISADLTAAVNKLATLRDSGTSLAQYLAQTGLYGPDLSPEAVRVLQVFDQSKRRTGAIRDFLHAYADGIDRLGNPNQVDLTGRTRVPSALEVLDLAARQAAGEPPGGLGLAGTVPPGEGLIQEPTPVRATVEQGVGALTGTPVESITARDAAMRQNRDEAQAMSAAASELGYVRIAPGRTPPGISAETAEALQAGRQRPPLISGAFHDLRQRIKESFGYGGKLLSVEHLPVGITRAKLVNDFRLFQNRVTHLVGENVRQAIAGVIQPLTRNEFLTFQDYIFLREFNEEVRVAARQGRASSVPRHIDPAVLAQDLRIVEGQLTPNILAAVDRHDRLQHAVTADLVKRGLDPEFAREHYMRHFVLEYDERYKGWLGVPRRIRAPYRKYLRGRTGSAADIVTDYLDVMYRTLSRVDLDDAVDHFMERTVKMADFLPTLTKAERQALFGPKERPTEVGRNYDVRGKRAVTWQYRPGNQFFPTMSVDEDLIKAAVAQSMSPEEIAAALAKGGRPILAMGRKHPMVLIDENLAQHLSQFGIPSKPGPLFPNINATTRIWKRLIIDSLGVPFQMRFLVGHTERFFAMSGDLAAAPNVWRAAKIIAGDVSQATPGFRDFLLKVRLAEAGPEADRILKLAQEQAVIRSGPQGWISRNPAYDPRFLHLQDSLTRVLRIPEQMLSGYERLWTVPQEAVRLAKFMKDLERIHRGEEVVYTGAIKGLEGLSPIEQAGRVSREAFIDYGARSPFEQTGSDFLAPFITFHFRNLRDWINLGRRDPKWVLPIVGMYTTMVAYNNALFPEIEKRLPGWLRLQPHVNTGWKTGDGRSIIVTFQTASYAAARTIGLDIAGDNLIQAVLGRKSAAQAAQDTVTQAPAAAGHALQAIGGPFPSAFMAGFANRDLMTGAPIAPPQIEQTPTGMGIKRERIFETIAPPYGAVRRIMRDPGVGTVTPLQEALMRIGFAKAPNLESETQRQQQQILRAGEAATAEKMYQVEQAYIESGGDRDAVGKRMAELNARGGVQVTGEQVARRLAEPRVQIQMLDRQLHATIDQAARDAITQQITRLREAMIRDMFKRVPKGARPDVMQQLQKQVPPSRPATTDPWSDFRAPAP